ncbi:hypothetical protein QZM64_24455 [Burkholderia cepacia]|uniref:hypothetical protein n=1 Tax=Burkholderia cepacia TaxID=292 RepID=UPI000A93B3FE|nr:hypothetical protein [Burkholderia cepacia]MDN7442316.1 hypothetical protein [Burkholderia cepacia]
MIVALAAISNVRHRVEPTLSIDTIVTPRCERLYSTAIPRTFASGTAARDLATETIGLGFTFGAPCFDGLTATVFATWRFGVNAVPSFRIVYMPTRAVRRADRRSALASAQRCGARLRSGMDDPAVPHRDRAARREPAERRHHARPCKRSAVVRVGTSRCGFRLRGAWHDAARQSGRYDSTTSAAQ